MPRMNLYAPISGVFKDSEPAAPSGATTSAPGTTSQGGKPGASVVPKNGSTGLNPGKEAGKKEKSEAKLGVGRGGTFNALNKVGIAVTNIKLLIDETEVDKYNEKAEALFGTGIHPEPEKVYTTKKDAATLKELNAGVVSITGEELEAIKKDEEVKKLKTIEEVKVDEKNVVKKDLPVVDPDAVLVKKEKSEVVVPHAPKVVSYDEQGEQVLEDAKVVLEAREVRTPGELTASEALERALNITNKKGDEELSDIRSKKVLRVFIGTNPGFRSHPLILKFGTARVATLPLDVIYKLLEAGAHLYTVPESDVAIDNTKLANDRLVLTFLKDSPADSKDVIKEGLGNIMTYSAYVKVVKQYENKKVEEAKKADEDAIEGLLLEVKDGIDKLNREELIHRIKNIGYIESLVADYEVKHAETETNVKKYLGETKAAFEQLKTAMKTAKR